MDRRNTPRIKFARKPGFTVKLFMRRFFLTDREILGVLRDLSDGGATLFIHDDYRKYITRSSKGKEVRLISEISGLSFRIERKGTINRVSESNKHVSVVVVFNKRAAS
jgi:hypothetical protein